MLKTIKIYADGACIGNPGPGGWAAVLLYGEHRKEIYGHEPDTTNNRMELTAVIKGLESIKPKHHNKHVEVFTDSKYVRDGITKWIHSWKGRGWRLSNNKPVKNQDLWKHLDKLRRDKVKFNWIPGHVGIPENERADVLANLAARGVEDPIKACETVYKEITGV